MMLNKDEVIQRGLIVGGCSRESMPDVGYNLRIATLIGKGSDGKTETYDDDFNLDPSGVAAVVSKEIVKLPGDICAYASVKTSLCREGVLAINIGIIDPGWEGQISSFLLNFGKDPYRLKSGEEFLRLTFHSLTRAQGFVVPHPNDREPYESQVRTKFDKRLAGSFMDFKRAAEKGSEKLVANMRSTLLFYVPLCVLLLSALAFLFNWGVLSIASRAMPYDVVQLRAKALTEDIQKQADELRRQNQILEKRLDEMKTQLDIQSKKKGTS